MAKTGQKKQFFPPVPKTPAPQGVRHESSVDEQVAEDIEKTIGQHLAPAQRISFQDLPLDRIRPNPYQARREFGDDDLEELAVAIRQHGFISVLLVRPDPHEDGYFQLAYGERRWRAAQRVEGIEAVPCRIVAYTDDQMEDIGLIENLQRKALNPMEEARALQSMLRRVNPATGAPFSIRTLAEHLGVKKHRVEEPLRLCDVPEDVQAMVRQRADTVRVAFEIAKLPEQHLRQPLIDLVLLKETNTREVMYLVEQSLAQWQMQEARSQQWAPPPSSLEGDGQFEQGQVEARAPESSLGVPQHPDQARASAHHAETLPASSLDETSLPPAPPTSSFDLVRFQQERKLRQDVRAVGAVVQRWSEWAKTGELHPRNTSDVRYQVSDWIRELKKLHDLLKEQDSQNQ
ncbi:MAG TPA: ParB/RepB/Spo0J family partition protein [Ktedonosporobacter sp.]|nr:ParB/RepB/Spo0J family partition protein [Ktedonosporobacter sp.]